LSTIGVVFGGPSPEHDISILTGLQAARALADGGAQVTALYWTKTGDWYEVAAGSEAQAFLEGPPRGSRQLALRLGSDGGFASEGGLRRQRLDIDVVVNCCHGGPGEDGTLQGVLDLAGLRYTGPTAAGAFLGMDKLAFHDLLAGAGIPALPRLALTAESGAPPFDPPFIVKPRFGGSSIGIHVVDDAATAAALVRSQPLLRDGAVIEPYRAEAVDLNVSVRTHPALEVSAVERPLRPEGKGDGIYSYEEKYLQGAGLEGARRELPAQLPDGLEARLVEAARRVAEVALVRSVARIDFLWSGDDVWVNEINTIPGAMAKYFWEQRGIAFGQQLRDMVDEARQGRGRQFSVQGADGTALRSARAIADKLA
jgi:D-alanine-D-alanine ligase